MKIIRSLLTGIVALVLLPGLFGLATPPVNASLAKVQPILAELAVNNPDQRVAVIVQKYSPDIQVESQVERLGGKVTKDLHIINGFAAEMSAGAALELAQDPQVRWISLDGVVESTGVLSITQGKKTPPREEAVNYYLDTLGVRNVWAMGLQGQGITVAVIDSGINKDADFNQVKASGTETTLKPGHDRIILQKSFNSNARRIQDVYGHGTHVAGIIGGNGTNSRGEIMGIAPQVQLISLKVCDENGMAYESDVVVAMQWVLDKKAIYNIRILNMSINSTVEQTYHTSPMDAA
ncbi:MAG: S8 family serine peptidase, partial [Anaerolineales bacterium]|nr:S8 family serine peptidase [Anaerolineales bacterium]